MCCETIDSKFIKSKYRFSARKGNQYYIERSEMFEESFKGFQLSP